MSQLSADLVQSFEAPAVDNELPVKDNVVIYRGSAVGLTSGYARQLVAGDIFGGFAEQKVDNTVTNHADGFKSVPVRREGYVQLAVGSVAVTDIGKAVYASDGNTYTLTQSTNTPVGTVHRFVSGGVAIVKFNALRPGLLAGITALTDSSGGTANNTVQAISGSFSQSEIANNFADLAAKVNEIINYLK